MKLGQRVNSHRAVYAPQAVSSIAAGIGQTLRNGGNLHFEIKPVRLPDFGGIGYFPFNRSEQVLAIAQRLAIQPVVSPAVYGVEAQENSISGPCRRDVKLSGQGGGFVLGLVKINPLARWSYLDVARYEADHQLPVHPLRREGYLSIGCSPTTRPVSPLEDPRTGRWPGTAKTECGLHSPDVERRG